MNMIYLRSVKNVWVIQLMLNIKKAAISKLDLFFCAV